MAVKNHALDSKIIDAAKVEFLEFGYQKTSVHNIAKRAGLTTGALYTRYIGKDELFSSLVADLVNFINDHFEPMHTLYVEARQSKNSEKLLDAIKEEQKLYVETLCRCYDECKLFFCKSEGSTMGDTLKKMLNDKTDRTVEFINSLSDKKVNPNGIELIMYEQFDYYNKILSKDYDKKDIVSIMEIVNTFVLAGWRKILEDLI